MLALFLGTDQLHLKLFEFGSSRRALVAPLSLSLLGDQDVTRFPTVIEDEVAYLGLLV